MISTESRKRRIRYLITSLLIPLLILFLVVFFGLKKYGYIFTQDRVKQQNIDTNVDVEKGNNEDKIPDPTPLPEPGAPDNNPDENIVDEEKPVEDTDKDVKGENTGGSTDKPEDAWWSYPAVIKDVTRSGDDLLVLVNKEYKLPATYAPKDLVYANTAGIRVTTTKSYMLRSILIKDLKELNTAAKAAGIDLSIISGYRSYAAQDSTYKYWVNYNGGNEDEVDKISARPGHSQHQLGTAMDFSSSEIADQLGDAFTNTRAGKWLAENAWKYGFVISYPEGYESTTRYQYESWHYRYIGREYAKELRNSGMILEEWLKTKN